MTIENTGTTYALAVLFTNSADYNTLLNCKLVVNTSYTGSWTQVAQSSSAESSTGGTGNNANYNLIKNCEIIGGYYGICFYGASTSAPCIGNEFIGNTFTGQYYNAAYLYYQREVVIQYNDIDIGLRYNTAYGIMSYYGQKSKIDGNIIKPGYYGMYLYYENYYSSSDSTMITNNIIYDFKYPSYNSQRDNPNVLKLCHIFILLSLLCKDSE
jgi:nitrous oxidase accessory protein NosD